MDSLGFKKEMRSISASQSGLALVMVILVVALISTLQVFMIEEQHLLVRRIGNQIAAEKGYQYAQGVNAWAARVLHEDENRGSDYLKEDWAKFGKPPEDTTPGSTPGETGSTESERKNFSLNLSSQGEEKEQPVIDFGFDGLEYEIIDLQGRFNLNNFSNKSPDILKGQKTIFLNLLDVLEIGQLEDRELLFGALVDWIDENDLASANGYESSDYQVKATPYYAADQLLTSIGELRFVEGFTEEIITALKPHVAVLPVPFAAINLNTASVELVAALSSAPVTDLGSVEAFLAQRENEAFLGFQSPDIQAAKTAIIGASVVKSVPVPNMLQTTSQFFMINTRVVLGDYRYCMHTSVLRSPSAETSSSAPGISVIRREYDTFCQLGEVAAAS